ncbi:hypothetical protein DL89DRAFT_64100 [Linderina pennispora]|uniref:Uncharacterized protein n=1 Tax=Linderina pennispora TaxID=61395 RepID=A0A1Y1VYX7_9FUNG|nr:uncharacterized protein DL89DRAFT_64100 [Linderina pennispora]ORX66471.1 hypothetical protein DL89DRAFT_64100 [Linderina pennispora]
MSRCVALTFCRWPLLPRPPLPMCLVTCRPTGCGSCRCAISTRTPSPRRRILLKPLVAGIVERMEQLLEEWPDHAVLQDICKLARQLLQLPVTAPLAKLLTGLEMLYQKSQEWQAYASRDVSIEQLADVARLIVRWRQQELNAWPHLLLSQELEFARRPNEWWFNLYSSLLGDTADFAGLVSAIDQFMQGSPAGEFRGRLNMLHAFCGHRAALLSAQALQEHKSVMDLKRSDPVYAPLSNAIDYYSQYAVVIAEHLAAAKKTGQEGPDAVCQDLVVEGCEPGGIEGECIAHPPSSDKVCQAVARGTEPADLPNHPDCAIRQYCPCQGAHRPAGAFAAERCGH